MNTNTAHAVKTTEWSTCFDGSYRIMVIDRCPTCQTAEAHVVEWLGETPRCQVCCNVVCLDTPAPVQVESYWAHLEHHKTCQTCRPARTCDEGRKIYAEMARDKARHNTPYIAITASGRKHGCWELQEAKALVAVNGGKVVDQTHKFTI